MRYLMAIVLILLLAAGSVLFFYWDEMWALGLPVFYVVGRQTVVRILWRTCWFLVLLPVMPEVARHHYVHLCLASKHAAAAFGEELVIIWRWAPRPIKVAMIVAAAVLSGVVAVILLILPVHLRDIPFVGNWLRETCVPYLMRSATAKGIELHLPVAWLRIPVGVRRIVSRPYLWLWWRTAYLLVGTRQAFGSNVARFRQKKRDR